MKNTPLAHALILIFLLLLLSPLPFPSRAQERQITVQGPREGRRVALVIGNSAYAFAPLKNPANDARDVAQALRELGFEVTHKENLSQKEMKRAVRDFGGAIRGGVGLFYYAGHGVQVKGVNYLVPVGAEIASEEEVEYECVDIGFVLAQMESAANGMNLVILDACRNNPFARSFRSVSRGLALMDAPAGTLIAYATAPGSIASDGDGRNGIYTQELLKFMRVPNLSVEEFFKQVRISVRGITQGKQTPWESSSLIGSFYFNRTGAAAPTSAASAPELEAPAGVPRPPAPVKKAAQGRAAVRHFVMELDSCKRSGADVTCHLMVTNESEESRQLTLCHSDHRATRRGMDASKAVDTVGNDYRVMESQIGTKKFRNAYYNQAVLAPGVGMKLLLKFENVADESAAFSLLRVAIYGDSTGVVALYYADFRDVPIER
ncbi:MAG TPA: caspase domain-containing protein [Pyrinomonadaceae bacterium]|nr:caspase domain-containing protein [Pyrinomonadaceae bacterium]